MNQNNLKTKFKELSRKLKINKPLNFKALLISNIVLASLIFCILIVVLVLLCTLPFPQRTMVDYMDPQMKRDGEAALLISLTAFVFILIPSYIALLITSALVAYNFFIKNPNKEENEPFNQKWYINLGLFVFCFFYILLPICFVWFFFIPYEKWILASYKTIQLDTKNLKNKKSIWISIITLLTLGISSIIPAIVFSMLFPSTANTPNRKTTLDNMYTISKDKPNTIVLYFDRAYGLFWNQLLMVDYLLAHDNSLPSNSRVPYSFIEEFPEFTSYVQSISQSMVTNSSNPMINGSWYYQPDFKSMKLLDPFYGSEIQKENMNDWFFNSYRMAYGLMSKYGYRNFNLMNPPYYGSKSYQLNADAIALQNRLQNSWNKNEFYPTNQNQPNELSRFLSMDVTEAMKSYGLKVTHSKIDEINLLRNFASSFNNYQPSKQSEIQSNNPLGNNQPFTINGKSIEPNLKVKNQDSTFLMMQFQTTHENYQYVTNEFYVDDTYNPGGINYSNVDMGKVVQTDPKPNNFIISMWYAIQKLKRILMYLKSLPCDRPGITNQYDNTNIYIISDHGAPIVNDYSYWWKINQYLIKNQKMTLQQAQYIDKKIINNQEISFGFWNSIFMRKPAKLSTDKNKVKSIDDFFNQTDLFVDSDFLPIIEGDLQRQYKDVEGNKNISFDEKDSWYYNPETQSFRTFNSSNPSYQKLIEYDFTNNFLFDPINNEKFKLNNRNVPLYMTDWLFNGKSKKYKMQYKYYFIPKENNKGGIFNINNYKLYKKYI